MARTPVTTRTTLDALFSDAKSELEELGEEVREVFDNMPENLKGSSVGEAREACADALEQLPDAELPKKYAGREVNYTTFPLKAKASRASRRDNALAKLEQVIQELTEIKEDLEDKPESEANTAEIDELDSAIQEIESLKDEADAVEFPGMYGK